MQNTECECSEEYGPCVQHGEVLAQREGASVRTADELCVMFILDALSCGAELSPYGADVLARADANLAANERSGVAWFSNDEDGQSLADEVRSLVDQVESTLDAVTYWEDGYQIVRLSDDCPLYQ